MDGFAELNKVLVNLFNEVLAVEMQAMQTEKFKDITNNDMHVIDAIGIGEEQNMSTVAAKLSVTVGSLTIAINGLVKKGYVHRERSKKDRRVVHIALSEKGIEAYRYHERFHQSMVEEIVDEMDAQELDVLIRALKKVDGWIAKRKEEN